MTSRAPTTSVTRRGAPEAANKAEFDELLAQGENPYEVFRRRAEDERVANRKKAHQVDAAREGRLAKNMIVEDERGAARSSAPRTRRGRAPLPMQQGRTYAENMTTNYLKRTTRGGVDMVDPTGRSLRVDPSQVTVIKDKTFGLGFSNRQNDTQEDRLQWLTKLPEGPEQRRVV